MRVVDPWHWLNEDGSLPCDNPRLFRRTLRIARIIEYGGPLGIGEMRETLLQCSRRPARKPCPGLLWVIKTQQDAIVAHCVSCKGDEVLVHNWQETQWANGMTKPVPTKSESDSGLH